MSLPVPTQKEVADFKALYEQVFNVLLTAEEALLVTTCDLQIYYVKHYVMLGQWPHQLQGVPDS